MAKQGIAMYQTSISLKARRPSISNKIKAPITVQSPGSKRTSEATIISTVKAVERLKAGGLR